MFPTDKNNINELTALAEQFSSIQANLEAHESMDEIYTPAHRRAYLRLQNAINDYLADQFNDAKSKSLSNAIDNFQTANEIMVMRVSHAIEKLEAN